MAKVAVVFYEDFHFVLACIGMGFGVLSAVYIVPNLFFFLVNGVQF